MKSGSNMLVDVVMDLNNEKALVKSSKPCENSLESNDLQGWYILMRVSTIRNQENFSEKY